MGILSAVAVSTASARGYFHAFGAMRAFLLPLLLAPVVLNGQDLVLRVQADASLVEVRGVELMLSQSQSPSQ